MKYSQLVIWLLVLVSHTTAQFRFHWPFGSRTRAQCFNNPPVGCFPSTGVYRNTGDFQPENPNEIRIKFIHHRPQGTQRFEWDDAFQTMTGWFNSSLKTVVLIHGYLESGDESWITLMAQRLLDREPLNVFAVDWERGASHVVYFQSAANTRMVGAVTALFIQELMRLGASPSNFHLIGFSLGAHVAGQAGMRVPGIGRITGLDPAGPCFDTYDALVRLDPTDAAFVDVIHTDAGTRNLLQGEGHGMSAPCGTVDFYPNGGVSQPGCAAGIINRLSSLISDFDFSTDALTSAVGCAHSRAYQLFAASMSHECNYAISRCRSRNAARLNRCRRCTPGRCPRFGYSIEPINGTIPSGIYRFSTSGTSPYC